MSWRAKWSGRYGRRMLKTLAPPVYGPMVSLKFDAPQMSACFSTERKSVVTFRWISCLVVLFAAFLTPPAAVGQIDPPVRGKKYTLAPNNGPWMIMVTSFTLPPGVASAEEIPGGMTPEEAANQLVFELRTHGVPAYTYSLGRKTETIRTVDRLAEPETRTYTSQQQSVCVLAGNYQTIDPDNEASRTAVLTLRWIKHFRPRILTTDEPRAWVMYDYSRVGRESPREAPTPLISAFFTPNPLAGENNSSNMSPERAALMKSLNSGSKVSLLNNQGKYSLVVASFFGKSMMADDKKRLGGKFFNESFGSTLNRAARDAWELATCMRQRGLEAYVWHDVSCSVVTVGSFGSLQDPRIEKLKQKYRAKLKTKAGTQQQVLTAEYLTSSGGGNTGENTPDRWIFDPVPRLMKVPSL